MNKKRKQILSILAAGAVAVTMGLSAFAAPVNEATIDRNRKGSLSVYKYDITSAEKDGVWTADGYQSTGVYDETGVNNILGNPDKPKVLPNGDTSHGYAVKGVVFTYKKVAEISAFSNHGTVSHLFGFEAEGNEEIMLRAIGLSFADRETEAVVNGKQIYYFTSDTLMKAVTDSLADDPIGVKNALEAYVKDNGGTAMPETDSYGHTEATNLDLGLYLVVETKVSEYYCDSIGFQQVDFDESLTQKPDNLMTVVYVEPHKPPYIAEIEHTLEAEQKAVGGFIEPIYLDDVCLVGNEEAKLIGMEGNRRIGDGTSIIAGPFFICGLTEDDFRGLIAEEAEKYMTQFREPEEISREEVEADMGFTIYCGL